MTSAARNWRTRAFQRAQARLKPGDKLTVRRCPGRLATVRFVEWDGSWACSPTMLDISPIDIMKVNGEPVDFTAGEARPL